MSSVVFHKKGEQQRILQSYFKVYTFSENVHAYYTLGIDNRSSSFCKVPLIYRYSLMHEHVCKYAPVLLHMGVHVCGDQGTTSGVNLWYPSPW